MQEGEEEKTIQQEESLSLYPGRSNFRSIHVEARAENKEGFLT